MKLSYATSDQQVAEEGDEICTADPSESVPRALLHRTRISGVSFLVRLVHHIHHTWPPAPSPCILERYRGSLKLMWLYDDVEFRELELELELE